MTFKHIKFEDSPIMRSLEKVAREKGLVKPESVLQKLASRPAVKKIDSTPSNNLMENIFKLCEGLRGQGLVAEANELEVNYFQFKQAQTLYEAHKEKGEDLVHAAHPDGSHKLEGVAGEEATFEDILDQQVKALRVIEKMPTGKLSSASHVLSAVKKALGQASEDETATAAIKADLATVVKNVARINQLTSSELTVSIQEYENIIRELASDPKVDNLQRISDELSKLHTRLDPSSWLHYTTFGATGLSEDTWARVQGLLSGATTAAKEAIVKRKDFLSRKSEQEVNPTAPKPSAGGDLGRKILGVAAQYTALSGQLSSDDPKDADSLEKTKAWLKTKAAALQQLAQSFQNESDKESVVTVYQATLSKYVKALETIQKEWA